MNQLKQDIDDLKAAGHIAIAQQYMRMARCLKRLQRFAEERERYYVYMVTVAEQAERALGRFRG